MAHKPITRLKREYQWLVPGPFVALRGYDGVGGGQSG